MFFLSRTSRHVQLQLSLFFSLLLLCSLGTTLHVHALAHSHEHHLEHSHSYNNDHNDLNRVHFSHDHSHHEHHGDIVEFDASPIVSSSMGVLKNLTNNLFVLAIFIFLFALVLSTPLHRLVQHHRENKSILYGRYLLAPPLRAPPAYS